MPKPTAAAFPATLRHSNAAAPRRIPQRRRAPGPPDPGRIHRGRDHAPVREKLDLRHRAQAAIAGPVPGPRGLAGSASRDSGPLAGYLEIIYILSLVIPPPSAEELRRLPPPTPSADELRSRAIGNVLRNLATYNIEGVRPEDQHVNSLVIWLRKSALRSGGLSRPRGHDEDGGRWMVCGRT